MSTVLTGDQRGRIAAKLFEIGRQTFNQKEYRFDPEELYRLLQRAVEGRFDDSQCWTVDADGVVHFDVTSDGTSGPGWIECPGFVGDYAKSVIRSPEFKPTNGVTYHIAVLPGKNFADQARTTTNIRAEGDRRGWKHGKDISAEIACLIRRRFTNEQINAMGLRWIVTMHEAISDSDGCLDLLSAVASDAKPYLSACYAYPGYRWNSAIGFAFVEQVSS